MKIKKIFNLIPVPVLFTKFGLESWQAGKSYGFFVVIRPGYEYDHGLIAHELEHCKQHWKTLFLHSLIYKFSKTYREKCEIVAYKIQSNYNPESISLFADYIASRYNLDHSAEHYEEILRNKTAKV